MECRFRSDAPSDVPHLYAEPTHLLPPVSRLSKDILTTHPVDMLVLGPHLTTKERDAWQVRMGSSNVSPRVVLEIHPPEALFRDQSNPMSKAADTAWNRMGYTSTCRLIHNLCVGGVVEQEWLITARVSTDCIPGWEWPDFPTERVVRPMGNCLRTHGIPPRAYLSLPLPKKNTEKLSEMVIPDASRDPMPAQLGSYISTERGTRRLLNDELAIGLGVSKATLKGTYPTGRQLKSTVALHIWESLSPALDKPVSHETPSYLSPEELNVVEGPSSTVGSVQPVSMGDQPFQWKPPALKPGSPWNRVLFRHLVYAAHQYPEPAGLIREGMDILARHRQNYTDTHPDPHHLQLLWWEFPPEHWDALREGSDMGFLREPPHQVTPNSDMTEAQMDIAVEFLDELVDLGVLREDSTGTQMRANGPLFCLPKPGQIDQWRIISDMRRGGQNECIGPDPTVFPRPTTILNSLYTGGWSAVVDASKFFYQFRTRPTDQPFLGCVHPRDPSRTYLYEGLPMGAASSPALAGRYGAAFLRLLRQKHPDLFGTEVSFNSWSAGASYDSTVGHGTVLRCPDGQPAVLVFSHCDDFLLHGHTQERTRAGLTAFLDLAVQVGLLCHPGKLTPPAQLVKYTGFHFDSRATPCLRIPELKLDRSQAMITYALEHQHYLSRLALAVLVGTLESLVDATPSRIGHTYLRTLYELIHPIDWHGPDLPYFSYTELTPSATAELTMWQHILKLSHGMRRASSQHTGILITSYGDGSGTGTGGTIQYGLEATMEMWMGTWAPQVRHCTSNWREMRTLLATLERAAAKRHPLLAGSTFFYFTDNLVLYFAVTAGASTAPPLQALVRSIKLLELELGITLEVIHIPGTALIAQGTDGLSRGVWMSGLHARPSPRALTTAIFAACPMSMALLQWVRTQIPRGSSRHLHPRDWRLPWSFQTIAHRHTFWTLPPETAPVILSQLLQLYVEVPHTTSITVVVPRLLQRRWSRLSRHIVTLGEFDRRLLPVASSPTDPIVIPLVLLHLPCHSRTLPPPELDTSTPTALRIFHRQQAAFMRRVSPAST